MTGFVSLYAFVEINGVDLSDHVNSLQFNFEIELQEDTTMGTGYRTRLPGLRDWSAEVSFNQDYADAADPATLSNVVDKTLYPLVGADPFSIKMRHDTRSGPSVTNPQYEGTCLLPGYMPISGSVGEVNQFSVSFTGNGPIVRKTA